MWSRLLALFLFVASVCALNLTYLSDYHRLIGIPAAQRIKAIEDEIFANENSRIYMGQNVMINKYPFFAGLIIFFKNNAWIYSMCSAALISESHLLTAAHCWPRNCNPLPKEMEVVMGTNFLFRGYKGLRIRTNKVFRHPDFNTFTYTNDIAVIHLPRAIGYNDTIIPIALPMGEELTQSFEGVPVTSLGYDENDNVRLSLRERLTFEGRLKGVVLRIISDNACAQFYEYWEPGLICATGFGKQGPCDHDAGGPLIAYSFFTKELRKILVGITIAKLPEFAPTTNCGTETPALYTRISEHIDFIQFHAALPKVSYKFEERWNNHYETISVGENPPYTRRINEEGMLNMESCELL